MKKNLQIIIDSLFEFYKQQFNLDLSKSGYTLKFIDVNALLQTDSTFDPLTCEAMMQLLVHALAPLFSMEDLKQTFINLIFDSLDGES